MRLLAGNLVALSMAAVLMSNNLPAQPVDANAKLQFDVASVKPSQPDNEARAAALLRLTDMMPAGMIPMPDPGRVRIQGWTLCHLIAAAYRVRTDQVSGPVWIQDQNFDIEARLPEPDVRRAADPLMRQLLEDKYITPFQIEGSCAVLYETGGLSVTRRPCRVVDAQGRVNRRLFAFGVPT